MTNEEINTPRSSLGVPLGAFFGAVILILVGGALERHDNPAEIPCGHLHRDDSCVEKEGVWRCVWQDDEQVTHVVVCQEVSP